MVSRLCYGLLLCVLGSASLSVQTVAQSVEADRPSLSERAASLTQSTLQVEAGVAYAEGTLSTFEFGQLLVRYGFADGLELRAGINSLALTESAGEDGYTGTNVGVKVGLLCSTNPSCPFRLSMLADAALPTGTGSFEAPDNRVRQTLLLAAESMLGSGLALDTNAGVRFFYTDTTQEEWTLTSALRLSLTPGVEPYVGYAGFFPDGDTRNYVETGLLFQSSQTLQFDLNAGLRVDEDANEGFVGGGVTFQL